MRDNYETPALEYIIDHMKDFKVPSIIAACFKDVCGFVACGVVSCGANACAAHACGLNECGANASGAGACIIDVCPIDGCPVELFISRDANIAMGEQLSAATKGPEYLKYLDQKIHGGSVKLLRHLPDVDEIMAEISPDIIQRAREVGSLDELSTSEIDAVFAAIKKITKVLSQRSGTKSYRKRKSKK